MDGIAPIEWVVQGYSRYPAGIVRLLHLGADHEAYFRAVTYAPRSQDRKLIGYWGSLEEEAAAGIRAHEYDRLAPQQRANGPSSVRSRPVTAPMKPPPEAAHNKIRR